jgi:asparagine synthase (glutamine-hydrolysing)
MCVNLPPRYRIKGRTEKWVLREAVKGILPEVLYKREKFAFMAPPAHTDEKKWQQMKQLSDHHLSKKAVESAGLLSYQGVCDMFEKHDQPETSIAEKVQMDAVINHLMGVQVLHQHFIDTDIPVLARKRADELGWTI